MLILSRIRVVIAKGELYATVSWIWLSTSLLEQTFVLPSLLAMLNSPVCALSNVLKLANV